MPQESLYRSLGADDATRELRADMLFEHIQQHGLDLAVAFASESWDVKTSRAALSRFNVAMKAQKAEDAMLDKLAQRTARTKAITAKIKDASPLISPETIRALDQLIFELVAINPDDPRLDRLVKMAETLSRAADSNSNTKLNVQKFQFDAAKAVLTHADLVREVVASDSTEDEKTNRIGKAIFGEAWDK